MHYPPIWSTLIVLLLSSANSRTCRCRIIEHMKGTGEVCNSRTTEAALTIYYMHIVHIYIYRWMTLLIFFFVFARSAALLSSCVDPKNHFSPMWIVDRTGGPREPHSVTLHYECVDCESSRSLRKKRAASKDQNHHHQSNCAASKEQSNYNNNDNNRAKRKKTSHKQPRARYSIGPYGCPPPLPSSHGSVYAANGISDPRPRHRNKQGGRAKKTCSASHAVPHSNYGTDFRRALVTIIFFPLLFFSF